MRHQFLRAAKRSVEYVDSIVSTNQSASYSVSLVGLTFSAGDTCLLLFQCSSNGTASGAPSGWTTFHSDNFTGMDNRFLYRVMDGTETSVAFSGSSASVVESVIVIALRNADTPTASNWSVAAGTALNPPQVSPAAGPNDLIITMAYCNTNGSGDYITGGPSGFTLMENVDVIVGIYGHVSRCHYKLDCSPTEDPSAYTGNSLSTAARAVTFLIEAA